MKIAEQIVFSSLSPPVPKDGHSDFHPLWKVRLLGFACRRGRTGEAENAAKAEMKVQMLLYLHVLILLLTLSQRR